MIIPSKESRNNHFHVSMNVLGNKKPLRRMVIWFSLISVTLNKKPPEGGSCLFNHHQAGALNHLGFTPVNLVPPTKLMV